MALPSTRTLIFYAAFIALAPSATIAATVPPSCSASEIASTPQVIRSLHDLQVVLNDPSRAKDRCAALAELIRLGETRNSTATLMLGDIFVGGLLVAVDAQRAISYYLEALDLGDQSALLRLGDGLRRRLVSRSGYHLGGWLNSGGYVFGGGRVVSMFFGGHGFGPR